MSSSSVRKKFREIPLNLVHLLKHRVKFVQACVTVWIAGTCVQPLKSSVCFSVVVLVWDFWCGVFCGGFFVFQKV